MVTLDDIKHSIERMTVDEIAPIVRSAVGDESAVVDPGWTVETMSVDSIGMGTLGFLKIEGRVMISGAGSKWSSVVKTMDVEADSQFASYEGSFASQHREIQAYTSGFFDSLDGYLQAAPCHGITQFADATLLWLEDLSDSVQHPWGKKEFLESAYNIGYFNGSWPEDRAPSGTWLDRDFITNRPKFMMDGPWIDDFLNPRNKLVVTEVCREAGISTIARMPAEYAEVVASHARLPRVLTHNDLHSRNAFFRYEPQAAMMYVIDWASVGLGPVGLDGGTLAGGGTIWGENEARLIAEIEGQMFSEYVRGLNDSGYSYKRDEVRLGFLSNFTIYVRGFIRAAIVPDSGVARQYSTRFGVEGDEFFAHLTTRLRTFMTLFDEAVSLARQLG
jgi:hypothetical protein